MFSGSERDIPGFPRYELIGGVDLGEYNLMISRVSLTDDAEYQCQVMPAGGDPALMGSAHLHVLSEFIQIFQFWIYLFYRFTIICCVPWV